jgi:HSP20 family protein
MMEGSRRRRRDFDDVFDDDFFGFDDGFFKRMHERMDRIMREALGNFEDADLEPGRHVVYGFSMHTGQDGKPVMEEFGNVPSGGGGQLSGEREPLVDVIDGKDEVTVIAELPGVDKKDIDIDAGEESLTIRVDKEGRRYHKELMMPAAVDPDTIKAAYKNGVLEVKLKRKDAKTEKKKRIRVE